jgi:hypothetical protein
VATYGNHVNTPGEYPDPAFTGFGLPAPPDGTGAPGSPPFDAGPRQGTVNQPGEYPDRMPFGGTPLGETGAPGTQGIPPESQHSGPDSVSYTKFTNGYKPSRDEEPGEPTAQENAPVSGPADWTAANAYSYGGPDQWQMPGVVGNTPRAGEGPFQPGSGTVRVGGNRNGQR